MSYYQFGKDIKQIQDYMIEKLDLYIEVETINEMWTDFSNEEYSAGWIGVDKRILEEASKWFEKNKEDYL